MHDNQTPFFRYSLNPKTVHHYPSFLMLLSYHQEK